MKNSKNNGTTQTPQDVTSDPQTSNPPVSEGASPVDNKGGQSDASSQSGAGKPSRPIAKNLDIEQGLNTLLAGDGVLSGAAPVSVGQSQPSSTPVATAPKAGVAPGSVGMGAPKRSQTSMPPAAGAGIPNTIQSLLSEAELVGLDNMQLPADINMPVTEPKPGEGETPSGKTSPEKPGSTEPGASDTSNTSDTSDTSDVSGDDEDLDDEPPDNVKKDKKANAAWRKLRSRIRQQKQELESLRQQLEQHQESSNRIKELETKLSEYEEKLGKLDVTQSSKFQETYDRPLGEAFQRGVMLLVKAGRDEKTAIQDLQTLIRPDLDFNQLQELMADEPPALQGALAQVIAEIQQLAQKRQAAIERWKETKEALHEEEERSTFASLQKAADSLVTQAVNELVDEGSWLFQLSDQDENWNQGVRQRINAAKALVRDSEPQQLAKYIVEGMASRLYRTLFEKEHEKARKLATELRAFVESTPSVGGHTASSTVGPGGSLPDEGKPIERASVDETLDKLLS